jgi:hypothetical protein
MNANIPSGHIRHAGAVDRETDGMLDHLQQFGKEINTALLTFWEGFRCGQGTVTSKPSASRASCSSCSVPPTFGSIPARFSNRRSRVCETCAPINHLFEASLGCNQTNAQSRYFHSESRPGYFTSHLLGAAACGVKTTQWTNTPFGFSS